MLQANEIKETSGKMATMDFEKVEQVLNKDIGKRLRKCREELGLSREQMVSVTGRTLNTIASYEKGATPVPSDTLGIWAQACKVNIDYLIFGREQDDQYIDPATRKRLELITARYLDHKRPAFNLLVRQYLLDESEETLFFLAEFLEMKKGNFEFKKTEPEESAL